MKNKETNVIYIFGEIDADMLKDFMEALFDISRRNSEEITIYINSEGGCLYSMFAMHDLIKLVSNPIHTIGLGHVMSAAALILAAGDTRSASSNVAIMLHQPSSEDYEGRFTDVEQAVIHDRKLKKQMYELIAKYTGQTVKKITADLDQRDIYFNAKEAKQYGLIDDVLKTLPFAVQDDAED